MKKKILLLILTCVSLIGYTQVAELSVELSNYCTAPHGYYQRNIPHNFCIGSSSQYISLVKDSLQVEIFYSKIYPYRVEIQGFKDYESLEILLLDGGIFLPNNDRGYWICKKIKDKIVLQKQ